MTVTQTKFPFRLIDYKMGKQDDAPVLRLIWEITDELEMIHQYGIDPPREIGTNCQFELHRSRKTQTLEFILTLADWPPTDNNKVLGEPVTGKVRARLRSWLRLALHHGSYKCQEIVWLHWGEEREAFPINSRLVHVAPFAEHFTQLLQLLETESIRKSSMIPIRSGQKNYRTAPSHPYKLRRPQKLKYPHKSPPRDPTEQPHQTLDELKTSLFATFDRENIAVKVKEDIQFQDYVLETKLRGIHFSFIVPAGVTQMTVVLPKSRQRSLRGSHAFRKFWDTIVPKLMKKGFDLVLFEDEDLKVDEEFIAFIYHPPPSERTPARFVEKVQQFLNMVKWNKRNPRWNSAR